MCGRYTLSRPQQLVDELDAALGGLERGPDEDERLLRPRFNVAPTQTMPVVLFAEGEEAGSRPRLEGHAWGLQPPWRGGRKRRGAPLINARVETVAEKASFREAFATRRCLVPADGFYEWSAKERGHQPHLLTLTPEEPGDEPPGSPPGTCFAGLWEPLGAEGARVPEGFAPAQGRFVVLTTAANRSVAPLHDRMPLALPAHCWQRWLDDAADPDALLEMLAGDEVGAHARWSAHAVSERVNNVRHDDPTLLQQVGTAASNLSLF